MLSQTITLRSCVARGGRKPARRGGEGTGGGAGGDWSVNHAACLIDDIYTSMQQDRRQACTNMSREAVNVNIDIKIVCT